MKRFIKYLLIIVIFICFNANADNLRPVDIHGKLNVDGVNIVDKNNNIFQIRGISTHGIAWFPEYVNQEAFNYMRDEWNINAVRLAMYSDPNAGYSKDTVNKLKQGVEYAKNAGLYVIIDWHILNDNNPNIHKNEAIEFFKDVSNLYKDYDNVIYEICNEPNGGVEWKKDIKPYAEEVIKVIRERDNDAIIIVGTPTWSQDVDIVSKDPIKDQKNIMYTLHFYADTHRDNIRNKLITARKNNLPIFVTEFGIMDASGNGSLNYDEGNKWLKLLDENNISYMIWQLSNKDESASLIKKDVKKTSGWTMDDLAPHGKWYIEHLKTFEKEVELKESVPIITTGEDTNIETDKVNNNTEETNNDNKALDIIDKYKYLVIGFVVGISLVLIVKKIQK